ncbi:MAG: penicillin-binding protein [Candidatus Dormibacteraeota bacterium]|nr:penicillin-binding protein [Candidatus Dormibacteraeota bacterium]
MRRRRAGLRGQGTGIWSDPGKRLGMGLRTRRIVIMLAALFLIGVLSLGGAVAYAAMTLPDINTIGQATGTIKILDRNGQLLAEVGHNNQSRHDVQINQIATVMQTATIAAEDRNFYSEGAFDFPRVVKAVIDDLLARGAAEGASTITQQLVKQAFFGQAASKDPLRKIREALLAQEIEGKLNKAQILNEYLNITYYGENAYGIEDASMVYFGKHASELTPAEAALLAGLPEAPSYNDPFQNPQAAYARMHYVLGGLVVLNAMTQAQADAVDPLVGGDSATPAQVQQQQANQAAITKDLTNGKPSAGLGPAPHFVQYIENELQSQFANDPAYLNGDLTVTTTLDLSVQQKAVTAVTQGLPKIGNGANNAALLMLEPHTGQILAMVGSADFNNDGIGGQFNVTTQAERRPGSSFKPIVYEEGVRTGTVLPTTILQDTYAESQNLGGVQDFDRSYEGNITAKQALLGSRNIATEQAMVKAGVDNVINFAKQLGISTPLAENASTAIGSSAVRMTDLAAAYAAFANGGQRVTAYGILKVVDSSGNTLVDNGTPPGQETVMTASQGQTITDILRGYSNYWNLPVKWDSACKSGTTDSFVDAWYTCYTPSWVVTTWTGHTDVNNPGELGMDGVFGTTEGRYIATPFINSLPKPSPFPVVAPSVPLSTPTPTPAPTATPTPAPTATPTPTSTPFVLPTLFPACPTPTPTLTSPSPTPRPTACPT